MTTNENALIQVPQGGELQAYSPADLRAISNSGTFLPRIQLMTSNSKQCKAGDFPINNYAFITNQNYNDMGRQVDVLVIAFRPKAMEFGDEVISVYDPMLDRTKKPPQPTGEFKRIMDKSHEKDSGCMYGLEFLVWVPSREEFATFFMGTASSRPESENLSKRQGMFATLRSQKIERKKYSWYAPQVVPCSTSYPVPDQEAIDMEADKFNHPPSKSVEAVEADERER